MYKFSSNKDLFFNHILENTQFLLFDRKTGHQQKVEFDAIPPLLLYINLKASNSFKSNFIVLLKFKSIKSLSNFI